MSKKDFSNGDIARILREMATLYEMKGVQFKPRAYEKAALQIESLDEDMRKIWKEGGLGALDAIPGIGEGIARHIEALFKTGHFKEYDALKKKMPVNIEELIAVEGVGPQTVKILWKKLKIKNIKDLEKAARQGKIRKLSGFGKKSEEKILKGIEFVKQSGGRHVLGFIEPQILVLEKKIQHFPEVERVAIAGSVKRRKETIGDIDILVVATHPKKVMERFTKLPDISYVYGRGMTKTNVRLKNGLDADLRIVPQKSWGAALNYFIGSKSHNIALREIAIKKGWKLNEYGLFSALGGEKRRHTQNGRRKTQKKQEKFIAGRTEGELYKKLGLRYIEPELRENTGEIEAARLVPPLKLGATRGRPATPERQRGKRGEAKNKLPKLIGYNELKGDLQVQTNWTDGKDSIEKMAHAAEEAGLHYIAITDHTKSLAMTRGCDEKKLLKQIREIEKLNSKFEIRNSKFRLLAGAEVNIGKNGELDIKDEVLAKLDVVGAAVHSHFNLSRREQTRRIIKAMENPHVDIIFHLTGRRLNRRKPIELDIEATIKTAKRTKTVLEIDAYPDRLDIKDDYVRKCVEAGVKMCIDSDAHSAEHYKFLQYGIAQARRGWASRGDIINAWPLEKMLKLLKDNT